MCRVMGEVVIYLVKIHHEVSAESSETIVANPKFDIDKLDFSALEVSTGRAIEISAGMINLMKHQSEGKLFTVLTSVVSGMNAVCTIADKFMEVSDRDFFDTQHVLKALYYC